MKFSTEDYELVLELINQLLAEYDIDYADINLDEEDLKRYFILEVVDKINNLEEDSKSRDLQLTVLITTLILENFVLNYRLNRIEL